MNISVNHIAKNLFVDNTFPDVQEVKQYNTQLRLVAEEQPTISILGLGYVGAVSAACFCELGHEVIGVDPDERKVSQINEGKSPIVEEALPELLRHATENELLKATQDTESAILASDITFVSVGTPSNSDGSCDLRYLQEASAQIGRAIRLKQSFHLVVFRSTVPPSTTRETMIPIIEKSSGKTCGKDFGVCFNPEFLRESTAIQDFYHPPKTVIGASDEYSAQYAASLYEGKVQGEIIHTDIESAEFVKYVDNAWHALKVVFGNEIGRICKAMDVDSHNVMDIFCKDTKLNLSPYYLKPGFAYGGSCLPKDTRGINHLAKSLDVDVPVLRNISRSNDNHITHAEDMIEMLPGKRIGFLGITFKGGTDDLRESPTVTLIQRLTNKGYEVRFYDPNFKPEPLHDSDKSQQSARTTGQILSDMRSPSPHQLLDSCNMLVVTHGDDLFRDVVQSASGRLPVIDLVRLFENEIVDGEYHGICW